MFCRSSIYKGCIALLIVGLTLHGWLGSPTNASAQSQLSGFVFNDMDIDCVIDPATEGGLAGVEIVLTKLSDPDYLVSVLTNHIGYYEFTGLDPDVYTITQPAFPLGVRNTCVGVGALRDITSGDLLTNDFGTAVLLNQSEGILPHIEGIDLPDNATGTRYNFGQVYIGKAFLTTAPPPIIPEGGHIPEPSTAALFVIGGLFLGSRRKVRR